MSKHDVLKGVVALVVLVTAVLGLAAAPSSAKAPSKDPLPAADAQGRFCEDFDVLVHPTRNKEFIKVFSSGAALITGALRIEVTNLVTRETVEVNVPGPGRISPDGSTLIGTGPWLLFGEAGTFGEGSPAQINFIHGRFVAAFNDEGIVTSFTANGQIVDLCAVLAP
jgi:hypothetical protein